MQVDLEKIEPLLACPRCGSPLDKCGGSLACRDSMCPYHDDRFPVVNGLPVLVDFATSILDRSALEGSVACSPVPRTARTTLRSRMKHLLLGSNGVAARSEKALIDRVKALSPKPVVLVIGGGTVGNGLRALYEDPDVLLVPFDIYRSPHVCFVADAHRIPLSNGTVHGVWIQAVLEHVLEPQQVVAEIHRLLQAQGVVYAETPFMQQVHEGPYDFTRFTHSGHRWLFRQFDELASGIVAGAGTQMLWSVEHLTRALFRSRPMGMAAKALFAPLRLLDRLCDREYSVDTASAFFFFGQKTEQPFQPTAVPGYYRGHRR